MLPEIAEVGLYSSASSLMESLLIIVNSISPVLLAKVANQGNTFKSITMTLTLSKASFVLSALGILVIYAVPETFFEFVLGAGFTNIKELMMSYAPGILMGKFIRLHKLLFFQRSVNKN